MAIPGAVAIGLGVAAIAASQLLKNIKPRAAGGPVKKGHPYLVGEIGPEFFIPNQDGQILSNSASKSFVPNGLNSSILPTSSVSSFGSFSQGGKHRVVFEIAGTKLQAVLALTNQSLNRLT